MTTGEKIKRLRKERNMTQEELGAAIGVQKAAINKYETGIVVNLKRKTIENLAEVFDINPIWLMDDNADFPPVLSDRAIHQRGFNDYYAANGYPTASSEPLTEKEKQKKSNIKILFRGINRMTPENVERVLAVVEAMFDKNIDLFNERGNEDDA